MARSDPAVRSAYAALFGRAAVFCQRVLVDSIGRSAPLTGTPLQPGQIYPTRSCWPPSAMRARCGRHPQTAGDDAAPARSDWYAVDADPPSPAAVSPEPTRVKDAFGSDQWEATTVSNSVKAAMQPRNAPGRRAVRRSSPLPGTRSARWCLSVRAWPWACRGSVPAAPEARYSPRA